MLTIEQTVEAPDRSESLPIPALPRPKSWHWEYLAVFLVILLVAGIRFRLRDFPLERDEGEYAYAGQLILDGHPPYEYAYNMKLPGTYYAYAAIMAVFGQTIAGIHIGLLLVNAASIVLVFLIARKLLDPLAATVSAALFGLFSIRPILVGLAGHATHFVTLMALVSIFLLLRALDTQRTWLFFATGIFAGLAFLMKQPGLLFAAFVGIFLLWKEWPRPGVTGKSWPQLVRKEALLGAGVTLPYLTTCVVLWRAGVFSKFWFWTVSYARMYGSEVGWARGLKNFANRMELQKEHFFFVWFFIVLGVAAMLWEPRLRKHTVFLLGWLASSFLALSVGLYYRGHYFVMIYPVLATLAGAGVSAARSLLQRRTNAPKWLSYAAPLALFFFSFASSVYAERETYFIFTPHEAARYVYGLNPFPESIGIADFIRQNSSQDARIAVLGSEPQIYFYAHRLSATGYIYAYPLVEEQKFGSVMQSELIKEVESVKPEYIVYALTGASWDTREHADTHIFDWIESYIRAHYEFVGIADGGNHDIYRWGRDAVNYRPRKPEHLLLFHRVD